MAPYSPETHHSSYVKNEHVKVSKADIQSLRYVLATQIFLDPDHSLEENENAYQCPAAHNTDTTPHCPVLSQYRLSLALPPWNHCIKLSRCYPNEGNILPQKAAQMIPVCWPD